MCFELTIMGVISRYFSWINLTLVSSTSKHQFPDQRHLQKFDFGFEYLIDGSGGGSEGKLKFLHLHAV